MDQNEARKLCKEYVDEHGVPYIMKSAWGGHNYVGPPPEIYDAFPPRGHWSTKEIDWVATWEFLKEWKSPGVATNKLGQQVEIPKMDLSTKLLVDEGYKQGFLILTAILEWVAAPVAVPLWIIARLRAQ